MESSTVRVTKSQKFEIIKQALTALDSAYSQLGWNAFTVSFPGTETREGIILDTDSLREFCDSEMELITRRNSSSADPEKLTEAQKLNVGFKEEIKAFLATLPEYDPDDPDAKQGYTATEILNNTSMCGKYQISKVTSLLTQLGKGTKTRAGSGEVERIIGKKGVALFRLVQ